jgi:hypothetical protein
MALFFVYVVNVFLVIFVGLVSGAHVRVEEPPQLDKALKELDPFVYSWTSKIQNISMDHFNKSETKFDGDSAKCGPFCECMAAEMAQYILQGNTQRKLQVGVDDLIEHEHYIFSPGCSLGGDEYIIRKNEISDVWEWSFYPVYEDDRKMQCWNPATDERATCMSTHFLDDKDVFWKLRERGKVAKEFQFLLYLLKEYNPPRIFTKFGNSDINEDGSDVDESHAILIDAKYKREMCLKNTIHPSLNQSLNQSTVGGDWQHRCTCTKSACMRTIIEAAAKFSIELGNRLNLIGDSTQECGEKALDNMAKGLDILSLVPISVDFDLIKTFTAIYRGQAEVDESMDHSDNDFFEEAACDFYASVPMFGWSGPIFKAEFLRKGISQYRGTLKDLLDAIGNALRKTGQSEEKLATKMYAIADAIKPIVLRISNALGWLKDQVHDWVRMRDAENTPIQKELAEDDIANDMFVTHMRLGCGDFEWFARVNRELLNQLPTLRQKSNNFVQLLLLNMLQGIRDFLKEIDLPGFQNFENFLDAGGVECLGHCFDEMETFESEEGKASDGAPGATNGGGSIEQAAMELRGNKFRNEIGTLSVNLMTMEREIAVLRGKGDNPGTLNRINAKEAELGGIKAHLKAVEQELQTVHDQSKTDDEMNKQLAEYAKLSKSFGSSDRMNNAMKCMTKSALAFIDCSQSRAKNSGAECLFQRPAEKSVMDDSRIEYSFDDADHLRRRLKWETKHLSCKQMEALVEIPDPREMKKRGINARRPSAAMLARDEADATCDGVCQDKQKSTPTDRQTGSLEAPHEAADPTPMMLVELSARARCGCPTPAFEQLPQRLKGVPTVNDADMPSGEDVIRQQAQLEMKSDRNTNLESQAENVAREQGLLRGNMLLVELE